GVGILRPDGDSDTGADVLAVTVRTDYMPNEDWRTLCDRARTLRETEGTLTGHAAGHDTPPAQIGPGTIVEIIGAPTERTSVIESEPVELPEPLASVADYVDDHADGRDFIPTAELADAVGTDANVLG